LLDVENIMNTGTNDDKEWFYVVKLVSRKIESIQAHCTNKISSQELERLLDELTAYPWFALEMSFMDELKEAVAKYKSAITHLFGAIQTGTQTGGSEGSGGSE
jgi:hypothetical protein